MKRFLTIAVVTIAVVAIASAAHAIPRLQTYIVGSTYMDNFMGEEDSWVTFDDNFDLKVVAGWNGNPAQFAGDHLDTYLVIGVLTGETGTVKVNGSTLTELDFNNAAPFGVSPSIFTHAPMGDMNVAFYHLPSALTPNAGGAFNYAHGSIDGPFYGEEVTMSIEVDGFTAVHFDAVGEDWDGTIYKNPYSHDSTFGVPEPGTLSLLGTGLLGLIPVLRRKKKDVE